MALYKGKEVPQDAVKLSESEAMVYAWDLVNEWQNIYDTWALRYGPAVLAGVNAVSGKIINNHYRKKLKLGPYGYFSSVIPITVMPALFTALFHRHLVSSQILLMTKESCPLCYELRSASIQITFGIAYPMVLGPASAMMLAQRYSTSRLPSLLEGPKVVLNFVRKMTKPFTGTLAILGVTQLVFSSLITYFQLRNDFTLRRKISEIEENIIRDNDMSE